MNVFSLSQLQHMRIPAAKKIFATSTWKWNHTIINRLLFICWKRVFSCARLYCRWVARWLHPSWGTDELHYHGTTRLRVPCSPSYLQFRTAVLVKKPSQSMTTKNWMKGRSTGSSPRLEDEFPRKNWSFSRVYVNSLQTQPVFCEDWPGSRTLTWGRCLSILDGESLCLKMAFCRKFFTIKKWILFSNEDSTSINWNMIYIWVWVNTYRYIFGGMNIHKSQLWIGVH